MTEHDVPPEIVTPCRKRGYEVGDLFQVYFRCEKKDDLINHGALLRLEWDDGTEIPRFTVIVGFTSGVDRSGETIWLSVNLVKKLEDNHEPMR